MTIYREYGEYSYEDESPGPVEPTSNVPEVTANPKSESDDRSSPSTNVLRIDVDGIAQQIPRQQPLENPLNDYESYSYCLSLHLIGIDVFNRLISSNNPLQEYVPQNVLISSAGRYGSNFVRNQNFSEDFYFDDFRLRTYINTTARNRSSNLIECSFTIIEPNGFTLINRLLAAANEINPGPGTYLQMPYMLQIDFFGSQDGEIGQFSPIQGQTKYIPVRITNIKTKVSPKGTEYQVDAVPFNHQAFNQVNVSLPMATTVSGKTVADIFNGTNLNSNGTNNNFSSSFESNKQRQESLRLTRSALDFTSNPNDPIYIESLRSLENAYAETNKSIGVSGFCDAINNWFQYLKSQKLASQVNSISVVFDKEIGSAALMPYPVTTAATTASGNSTQDQIQGLQAAGNTANKAKVSITFDGATINIPAGMPIDKMIDWAVRNSKYIGDQIIDPDIKGKIQNGESPLTQLNQPLKWFKIIPRIKIRDFDSRQNRYSFDITFFVKSFTLAAKHPFAPRGRTPGFVKQYNYIFTGKNTDVLDLSIDFNTLFLVEVSANRAKDKVTETGVPAGTPGVDPNDTSSQGTNLNIQQSPNSAVAPLSVALVSENVGTTNRPGGLTQNSVSAGDLQRSIMTGAKGDMVSVSLKIIGDPHLIKQDDIFFNQNLNKSSSLLTPNNSIYSDGGELYVFLNFESPVDYNEELGVADVKNSRFRYSEFTGVYKLITVESNFYKGKFEQVLNLAKLFYDQEGLELPSIRQRAEGVQQRVLSPVARLTSTRYSGPSINLAALNPATNAQIAVNQVLQQSGVNRALNNIQQLGRQVVGKAVGQVTGAVTSSVLNPLSDAASKFITNNFGVGDLSSGAGFDQISGLDFSNLDSLTSLDTGLGFEDFAGADFGDIGDIGDFGNFSIDIL